MVCVTEKGECFPPTKTDGVNHINNEKDERKKSGHTCGAVKKGQRKEGGRLWTSKK